MPEVGYVRMPLAGPLALRGATLEIHTLPLTPGKLWDERGIPSADSSLESVQLCEGREYRYLFRLPDKAETPVTTDRQEVFIPDTVEGVSGRLRPGLFTGSLPVSVWAAGRQIGEIRLEVRASKLDYLTDYRWMLRDIADVASELAMDRFAASEMRFTSDMERDAETLYQRFAFLRETLLDERFLAAIRNVLSQPYVSWREQERVVRPGQGWSGGSSAVRQLAKRGPRVSAASLGGILGEVGVPATLFARRAEPTLDNVPNQFVKFALARWLDLVRAIEARLDLSDSATVQRGRRETRVVREHLEGQLAEGLFRGIGQLMQFPSGNQVLQKREGYRDVFRLYAVIEAASRISWTGGEDVYGAGQRNVASLYEYWAFIQLAEAVGFVCGRSFRWDDLLAPADNGLTLDLRRGTTSRLSGIVDRRGRRLALDLYFNRTFGHRVGADTSWTRSMRPDCSLRIRDVDDRMSLGPVWLHFDAKYRIQVLDDIIERDSGTAGDDQRHNGIAADVRSKSKRDDLLKMHAYRDAIRQSVGAYTLYPGTEHDVMSEFSELLPGLGAFALRPSETGKALGRATLEQFLMGVVDHLSSQVTQHERGRFWGHLAYGKARDYLSIPNAGFLKEPPADTKVVLAFVGSAAQWKWIRENRLYNLRAARPSGSVGVRSKALSAQLLVLYSAHSDAVEIWTIDSEPLIFERERLLELNYPEPRGDLYFCLPLGEEVGRSWKGRLDVARIHEVRARVDAGAVKGAPVATDWATLLEI